jgi:hypothetical protein
MSSDTVLTESEASNKVREQLLPPVFFASLNLLWICVLPLILLLGINSQAIWLCYGEIQEEASRQAAWGVLLVNGLMIVALALMSLALKKAGKGLSLGWFFLLLALHAGFIWFDFYYLTEALPWTAPEWILGRETLMLAQLACVMPGAFFALLGLACYPSRLSKGKDILLSGGLLIIVPLFWYLFMQLGRVFSFSHYLPSLLMIPLGIISTALMFIGLLRLLIRLYTWLKAYQIVLVLITAFAFPLGGLLLNRAIPFPVNFQVTGIYVLTVVNALALLGGSFPRLRQNPWIILLQVVTFPFTLYFFVVFLPFLPLFIPAMILMGAGFLVLTPTLLFMVHGQRLLEVFFFLVVRWGKLRTGLIFLVMLAVLPSWFSGQAFLDRMTLHRGLDYIYTPKLYPRENFSGSADRIGSVLKNLVNFKEGQYLPILSDLYNRVVFDNLFLPDAKMEEMHQAFLGTPLPKAEKDLMADFSIWGGTSNRRSRSQMNMRPLQLPREQSVVQSIETKRIEDGDCARHTSIIRIKNNARVQNEFVATIDLPDGVLVSNYWLHIGDERVPGKLFEKKTALWVYEQIRDQSRRDPGILRYIGPNRLELRVFPLESGEVRTTEIEFLCPTSLRTQVKLNSSVLFEQTETNGPIKRIKYSGGQALLLSQQKNTSTVFPVFLQGAYLHFILDHSIHSQKTAKEWSQKLQQIAVAPEFKGIEQYRITLTNFESKVLGDELRSFDSEHLFTAKDLESANRKGGFLPDKALREEILEYEASRRWEEDGSFRKYPVFVVVSSAETYFKTTETLPYFLKQGAYPLYTVLGDSTNPLLIEGSDSASLTRPVVAGTMGNTLFIFPPFEQNWIGYTKDEGDLRIYDPKQGFVSMTADEMTNQSYAKGLEVHAIEERLRHDPSKKVGSLADLVHQSKESGVLVPATSYIVVENSAQWKILLLKEKQKLGGHEVMELQEASEPSWLVVALVFVALAWLRSRYRRSRIEGLS